MSYVRNAEENYRPVPLSAVEYDTGNVYAVGESAAAWINGGNLWFTQLSLLNLFIRSQVNSMFEFAKLVIQNIFVLCL
mgnify:CR=1 FL=1